MYNITLHLSLDFPFPALPRYRRDSKLHHRSNSLFHFTKQYQTLLQILNNGFRPRYSREDIRWLGFSGDSEIGVPMVSFCDIPLSLNEVHIRDFGAYGLGMSRDWAQRNYITPVRYVQEDSPVAEQYRSLRESAKDQMQLLTTTLQNIWFFEECEWRYVPQSKCGVHIHQYIVDTTFNDPEKLDRRNRNLEDNAMLVFEPSDIQCIVVNKDSEKAAIASEVDRIYGRLDKAQLTELHSKIRSIEESRLSFISM